MEISTNEIATAPFFEEWIGVIQQTISSIGINNAGTDIERECVRDSMETQKRGQEPLQDSGSFSVQTKDKVNGRAENTDVAVSSNLPKQSNQHMQDTYQKPKSRQKQASLGMSTSSRKPTEKKITLPSVEQPAVVDNGRLSSSKEESPGSESQMQSYLTQLGSGLFGPVAGDANMRLFFYSVNLAVPELIL